MNYEEFLKYIEDNLAELMNAKELQLREKLSEKEREELKVCEIAYTAQLHKIVKNNGLVLDGITLLNKGECSGPNIYLNNFYDEYQVGRSISTIMDKIIEMYLQARGENYVEILDILDFNIVKNRIILRLVNYERNKEQLKECPYKMYEDLAITFRYLAENGNNGIASSLIHNREFECWDISMDELFKIALENTIREFPTRMESLTKIVTEYFEDELPESIRTKFTSDAEALEYMDDLIKMYVLTNSVGLNGATCILYPGVLKQFADRFGSNLFVLPSSIHECILVLDDKLDIAFLKNMVKEANQTAVGLIDLLSDSVYYYSRESDTLKLV